MLYITIILSTLLTHLPLAQSVSLFSSIKLSEGAQPRHCLQCNTTMAADPDIARMCCPVEVGWSTCFLFASHGKDEFDHNCKDDVTNTIQTNWF